MPTGSRFARTAYVIFVVAVLLALLRLGGFSGTNPLYLKMVPTILSRRLRNRWSGRRDKSYTRTYLMAAS